ncbi:MAG: MFS transporter [Sulfolobaceae archaeon]
MSNNPFESIDNLKLSFAHIKIWYTAGMGFFTDAYDLVNIGYILAIFQDSPKYAGISLQGFSDYLTGPNSAFWTGLLASIAIWSAVIGQLLFGFLGDYWGRKKVYGIEATLLTLGACLEEVSKEKIKT